MSCLAFILCSFLKPRIARKQNCTTDLYLGNDQYFCGNDGTYFSILWMVK